jgi:hypothetical protein
MVIREPLRDVWHPQYECMNSSRNATKRPLHGVMLMSILACIANALAWRAIEGDPKSAGTIIQCALAALLLIHLLRAVMHAVFRKPAPRHGRHADRGRISSVRTFTDECVGESAVAPRCADEYVYPWLSCRRQTESAATILQLSANYRRMRRRSWPANLTPRRCRNSRTRARVDTSASYGSSTAAGDRQRAD